MENGKEQYGFNIRDRENFLVNTPATAEVVRDIEKQINDYLSTFDDDEDMQDDESFLVEKIDELNACLHPPIQLNCSIIGKAYLGDEFGIFPDINPLDKDFSNVKLVSLKGVTFQGFELRQVPGEPMHRAMIMCVDPGANTDQEEPSAYYFLPGDILSIEEPESIDQDTLLGYLQGQALRQRENTKGVEELSAEEQQDFLVDVARESALFISSQLGGMDVQVSTEVFYRIEYTRDYEARATKVSYESTGKKSNFIEVPVGTVRGVAFLEMILNENPGEQPSRFKSLIEKEACIMLSSGSSLPVYMIPISKVKNILPLMDSGYNF